MKEDSVYLNHILEAINNIFEDTNGFIEEQFLANRTIKDAVTRNIEIIGEAVKNIPDSFKKRYPSVPWRDIAGFRDVLTHAYFGVDLDKVWNVLEKDLPDLKKKILKIKKDLEKEDPSK